MPPRYSIMRENGFASRKANPREISIKPIVILEALPYEPLSLHNIRLHHHPS